jgi:hypothetical protein
VGNSPARRRIPHSSMQYVEMYPETISEQRFARSETTIATGTVVIIQLKIHPWRTDDQFFASKTLVTRPSRSVLLLISYSSPVAVANPSLRSTSVLTDSQIWTQNSSPFDISGILSLILLRCFKLISRSGCSVFHSSSVAEDVDSFCLAYVDSFCLASSLSVRPCHSFHQLKAEPEERTFSFSFLDPCHC